MTVLSYQSQSSATECIDITTNVEYHQSVMCPSHHQQSHKIQ